MVTHETYRRKDGKRGGGEWLSPGEVRIEGEGERRQAIEIDSGKPVEIGGIEKMSKSKKNVVDLDEFIAEFGADTVRWFVLSDSPPERDVIYTDVGVQGARRFVQRVWRMVDDIAEKVPASQSLPAEMAPSALALRRTAHKTLHAVTSNIEGLRFNVAIAQIYEFANAVQTGVGQLGASAPVGLAAAVRESAEFMVHMIMPFMPHLAEECWARLGYNTLIAEQPWPEADPALLVDDTITIAVQVNGKRRDELTIARAAAKEEVEAAALKLEGVIRAVGGAAVKKVIVVPQRIVNVIV
jgi:leucyl-tRNA synthetase